MDTFDLSKATRCAYHAMMVLGEDFPADVSDESNYCITPDQLRSAIECAIEEYFEEHQ